MSTSPTLQEVGQLLVPRLPMRFVPVIPLAQQAAFLLYEGEEALYGGAARGGKSVAMLMAAAQYVETPGYSALVIRKKLPDLRQPGGLLDMAHQWFSGTGARWIDMDNMWKFPSTATIKFGYLDTDKDKYNYQGGQYQFIGLDELTQFKEPQYNYLFSRLCRLAGSDVPIRMRGATNPPPDEDGEWVKKLFIDHPDIDADGNKMEHPRVFIKSSLKDNYHVDQKAYLLSLARLDPVTRAQLKDGSWDAERKGDRFKAEWFPSTFTIPVKQRAVRGWDFAATSEGDGAETASVRITRSVNSGLFVITDVTHARLTSAGVKTLVNETARMDGFLTKVIVPQDPGQAGKSQAADYKLDLKDYMFEAVRPTLDKVAHSKLTSAYAEQMKFELLQGFWNDHFRRHMAIFPFGPLKDIADAFFTAFDGILALKNAEWDVI